MLTESGPTPMVESLASPNHPMYVYDAQESSGGFTRFILYLLGITATYLTRESTKLSCITQVCEIVS